jgi:DNA-binding LytR/AlgR family response regulator
MDGLELGAMLRRRWPRIGLVLATGYSAALARQAAVQPAEVLNKPYRLDELAAALERALKAARALFSYCGRKNQPLEQCRPLSNGNPCRISVLSAVGRGRRMMALEALVS